jgi:hypothetical protein
MENKLPIFYASIDDSLKGIELKEQGVQSIALVDSPAMMSEWLMFNKTENVNMKFALNEEQRIITAPVIVADLPIYRKVDNKEFYVVYKKPIIMQIAQKYGAENRNKLIKLTHDTDLISKDVFVFESFVSDTTRGISQPKGFNLPDGTWFVSMKINNPEIWAKAKSGEIKGISLEGFFDLEQTATLSDNEVKAIIENIL